MTTPSQQRPGNDRPSPVVVFLSGRSRGRTLRLRGDRFVIGSDDAADVPVSPLDLPTRVILPPSPSELAVLQRTEQGFELTVSGEARFWVNGQEVERTSLASGDLVEIGQGGPVMRFRLYREGSRAYKTMGEAFNDCVDTARHGGRGPIGRATIMLAGTTRELLTQTAPLIRLSVFTLLALLLITATLGISNWRLGRELEQKTGPVRGLTELIEDNEQQSFSAGDFAAARTEIEGRLRRAEARVEALESRAGARKAVIAEASRSVVFLQGAYGFVDDESGRPLRFAEGGATAPGEPPVSLEGTGSPVEILYVGTAFVASEGGHLLTNRHVALPWEFDSMAQAIQNQGYRPVMRRFQGYLPGIPDPFDVELVSASDSADVALLLCGDVTGAVRPLPVADDAARIGDEVIVLGYPTGMQALLARVDPAFLLELQQAEAVDFWELAERLASGGHIAPLATVGVVGQVTPGTVVYDAETTHGGSGGPVLGLDGAVVAVNAAILPEFGGSNLGVPTAEPLRLLREAHSGESEASPEAAAPVGAPAEETPP